MRVYTVFYGFCQYIICTNSFSFPIIKIKITPKFQLLICWLFPLCVCLFSLLLCPLSRTRCPLSLSLSPLSNQNRNFIYIIVTTFWPICFAALLVRQVIWLLIYTQLTNHRDLSQVYDSCSFWSLTLSQKAMHKL